MNESNDYEEHDVELEYRESSFNILYHLMLFGAIFLMAVANWVGGNPIFAGALTVFAIISGYMLFRSAENNRNAKVAVEFERLDKLYW